MALYRQDMGNNETLARGIAEMNDGFGGKRFVAMTYSESKPFKTLLGAVKWLAKRGLAADGSPLKGRPS